jgi:hypothetical protein
MLSRRREPPLANRVVEREMREFRARMEAMEAAQRRAPNIGDVVMKKVKRLRFKKL